MSAVERNPAIVDELLVDGEPDPAIAMWEEIAPPLGRKAFDPHEARDEHGRWTDTGGGVATLEHVAAEITADEARGDSRPVGAEEFQRLAAEGRDELQSMMENAKTPSGLDRDMDLIQQRAYHVTQDSWGGATFDAHTGREFTSADNEFALSVKPPGVDTISIPEQASRREVDEAMQRAREQFSEQLAIQGGALGVFHDDDLKRIDIDPVIVVDSVDKVETIGAWTHAIGGAYHFASGNGFFPPHVMAQTKAKPKTPPPGPWPPVKGIARLASLRPAKRRQQPKK